MVSVGKRTALNIKSVQYEAIIPFKALPSRWFLARQVKQLLHFRFDALKSASRVTVGQCLFHLNIMSDTVL